MRRQRNRIEWALSILSADEMSRPSAAPRLSVRPCNQRAARRVPVPWLTCGGIDERTTA